MLTLNLNVGRPRFASASTPTPTLPANRLLTEAGESLLTEAGDYFTADVGSSTSFNNIYSVSFDGNNNIVSIPQGTFDLGTSNFTFSIWVRPTNLSASAFTYKDFFELRASAQSTTRTLRISGGTDVVLIRASSTASSTTTNESLTYYTGSQIMQNDSWYHILVVKNGTGPTDLHLYFNGSKVKEGRSSILLDLGNDNNTARLGCFGVTSQSPAGQIDEFAFWKSALSASDISSIYNSGTPGDLSSLSPVGHWRMGDDDGGTGTTVTDQGSGGSDATLQNGASFSTITP